MSNDPDQIRAEIERTRRNLSSNVDALTEQVKPGNVARRQGQKVAGAVSGLKDRVMGVADDVVSTGRDQAGSVVGGAQQAVAGAPGMARQRAQGNPMAAGLIALGAGWLLGSLLPSSAQERQASTALKEKAQPLADEVQALAREAGENLRPQVEEAVETVKASATDAVATVKSEGGAAVSEVKASAADAKDTVQQSREG